MLKRTLIVVLGIAAFIEIASGILALAFPSALTLLFKIPTLDATTLYLGALIGWQCLAMAAIVCLVIVWMSKEKTEARILTILLGIWWVAIGLWLFIGFNRVEHLFVDAVKGALILVLALLWKPQQGTKS